MDYNTLTPANDFKLNSWLTDHGLQHLGHNIELAISVQPGTQMQKLASLSVEQAQNLAVAVVPHGRTGQVVKLRSQIVALSSTQPEPEPYSAHLPQPAMCKYCQAKEAFQGHPYCGRGCAGKAAADGWVDGVPPTQPVASLGQQPAMAAAMCEHCGVKPAYGGHPYCGRRCAGKAAAAAAATAPPAAATAPPAKSGLFSRFNRFKAGGNMKRKHTNRKYTKRRSKKRKRKHSKRRSKKRKVNKTRRRRN